MIVAPSFMFEDVDDLTDLILKAHPRFALAMPGHLSQCGYVTTFMVRHIHLDWLISNQSFESRPDMWAINVPYTFYIQLGPSHSVTLDVLFQGSYPEGDFFQVLDAPLPWRECVQALHSSDTAKDLMLA